jgi:hypothetical protein
MSIAKYSIEQTDPPVLLGKLCRQCMIYRVKIGGTWLARRVSPLATSATEFHFCPPNYAPEQVFTASDLNLYYDPRHTNWYKRPDWFAVVGVSRLYEERDLRLSYVMWQEGVRPLVAVELLSLALKMKT